MEQCDDKQRLINRVELSESDENDVKLTNGINICVDDNIINAGNNGENLKDSLIILLNPTDSNVKKNGGSTFYVDLPASDRLVGLQKDVIKSLTYVNGGLGDEDDEDEDGDDELYNNKSMSSPLLDKDGDDKIPDKKENEVSVGTIIKKFDEPTENSLKTAVEVFFPYIIGGFGMVMAGYVLNKVQEVTSVN
ncbi:hypothetical protein HELRODRAFT_170530 [Helobdella robusta]|uniref:Uncharacterized protein n=1 Tax=Helobdella robusta TaxID=6412 RepID=T1F359_HELRO|nr:hypothetical protein HELRODRAFT_170530 [Helobdella robusta]ESO07217.1 hypothetical protein HELRODRAFT_170530 [Helobdella robusta]